ncbi:MAG: serine hydrolase domain-containing protein [Chthonomonadales bacterium]
MSLPKVNPESIGLDPLRLAVADSVVAAGVEKGAYPAAVLLVARHGKIGHLKAFGTLPGGAPVQTDTIFDLASLTKPHVATGLLTLLEDGKLVIGNSVSDFFPESAKTPVGDLTLRQLLTHSSGLPAWTALYNVKGDRNAKVAAILGQKLANPAGTHYTYSDLGYILVGEIVSTVSGMPLDQYLHARLFAPLEMHDTGYLPPAAERDRIAPTSNEQSRPGETMRGVVHDGNCHSMGGVTGHAGLFGTASDLAILSSALIGNGTIKGHRVVGMPTTELVANSQIGAEVGGHTFGWFAPPNGMLPRGDIFDDTTFGHTGFTGTMIVNNRSTQTTTILLTNRVMNPSENGEISRVRRRTLNAVASAIVK